VDIPRQHPIREASHRILNPYDDGKLALLGDAIGLEAGQTLLDLADIWDRYVAAQWMNTRRWLDANADDELAHEMRDDLRSSQLDYTRYGREYLGWGVFALLAR
jgi:hypothetical protein